jgi:DNA-binding transcriptional ArsR family regulator
LLPIFRSRLQADILAALLLSPDAEYSLTELAERFKAPLSTVHGEVKRLTDAGLLRRRAVGRSALVRADPGNRATKPLADLLLVSWGPLQVVADEFSDLSGAERVLIFGSWAARYLQHAGKPPHDLDVLVVGGSSREDVYDAADRAQQRLGMLVNPAIRSADAWRLASDPLVRQIQSSPMVTVLTPDSNGNSSDPLPDIRRSGDGGCVARKR